MTTASPGEIAPGAAQPGIEKQSGPLERVGSLAGSRTVLWLVVGAGVLLRLARYADNRSLWLDEAYLSLNIIDKSPTELLGKLDFLQAAPPGFLLLEKLAVVLLGDSEYVLRLVPLIAGIASLMVFQAVARRFLSPGALLLAVALFAVNEPLVYYASETKPYGSDVLVALVLLLLACRVTERAADRANLRLAMLAVGGLVGVWLSFPAVFVLAGIVVALLVHGGRNRRQLVASGGVGLLWLSSFAGLYFVTSQNTNRIVDAVFGPERSHTTAGLSQNVREAWGMFVDPGGFENGTNALAVLMFCFGVFALVRRDRVYWLALLVVPLAAAFGAAVLDKYPLGGRFSLFLAPFLLIVIARGVREIAASSNRPLLVALPIAAFLVLPSIALAGSNLIDPRAPEDIRPLLRYVTDQAQDGDVLYVYRNAQYALRYYGECDDCDSFQGRFPWPLRTSASEAGDGSQAAIKSVPPLMLVQQANSADQVLEDLDELDRLPRGKRIWFLFSHVQSPRGLNEEAVYLAYLDQNGRRIDGSRADGAAIYLYELSRPPS